MYSFRLNVDTGMVEVVKNDYVEYEIPKADWPRFGIEAWKACKYPTLLPRVRNLVDYTIK